MRRLVSLIGFLRNIGREINHRLSEFWSSTNELLGLGDSKIIERWRALLGNYLLYHTQRSRSDNPRFFDAEMKRGGTSNNRRRLALKRTRRNSLQGVHDQRWTLRQYGSRTLALAGETAPNTIHFTIFVQVEGSIKQLVVHNNISADSLFVPGRCCQVTTTCSIVTVCPAFVLANTMTAIRATFVLRQLSFFDKSQTFIISRVMPCFSVDRPNFPLNPSEVV